MPLFHKNVGIPPKYLDFFHGRSYDLITSNHALHAAKDDRYGVIIIPTRLTIIREEIIEIEINGCVVNKVVVRHHYNAKLDIVLVIIPRQNKTALIKTVWANRITDNHSTLNKRRYANN